MYIGIPILILQGLIIYFAIVGVRYTISRQHGSHGVTFIRDIFKYTAFLLTVVITCFGLSGILSNILEKIAGLYISELSLARWMAFAVIGVPLTALLARWIRKDFQHHPDQQSRPAWHLYLLIASTTSLLLWFIPAQSFLKVLAGDIYRPRALAQALVALVVWLIHQRLIRNHRSILTNAHRFIGWFIGAVSLAVGLITLLDYAIKSVIDFETGRFQLAEGLISILFGVIVINSYWSTFNSHASIQEARLYRLCGGVAVPFLFHTIALVFVLNTTLTWFFGDTSGTAPQYFRDLPQQISVVVVLTVAIGYFLKLTRGIKRDEISRAFSYLLGGACLIAAAAGIGNIVSGLLDNFRNDNGIIFGVSLAVVTFPHWLILWRKSQLAIHENSEAEQSSPIRRSYLYFFIGLPALAAIVSSVWLTFNLFKEILVGNQYLWQSRIPIAILIVSLAVGLFHYLNLQLSKTSAEISSKKNGAPRQD